MVNDPVIHTTLSDQQIEEVPLDVLEEIENAQADNEGLISTRVSGEESASGGSPAVTSDDDVVQMNEQVGLRTEDDYENPQELDIAKQFAEAEQAHRDA